MILISRHSCPKRVFGNVHSTRLRLNRQVSCPRKGGGRVCEEDFCNKIPVYRDLLFTTNIFHSSYTGGVQRPSSVPTK